MFKCASTFPPVPFASWELDDLSHQKALLDVDGLIFCTFQEILEDMALFSSAKILIPTSVKEKGDT